MDEKERIEREALAFFLRLYNRRYNRKFRIFVKRERPDFEVQDRWSKEKLGVEVSHIFHDKKEAMMMLGRDPSTIHGIITAQDHVDVLMEVLRKKAQKVRGYSCGSPVILVLRDFSRIFSAKILFDERLGLKIPASGYKQIWYLSRSRPTKKWDTLVRL
ncbi:MAG TPA: hypothetical protein PLZ86_00275, partial [bacterium]|nr:hypothetical protein [bacterium]